MAGSSYRNPSLLRPWRRVERVEGISAQGLVDAGVRLVMLDRDNTIVPRDAKTAPESVLAWINGLHAAGIATWMVSNNSHVEAVRKSAAEVSCKGIAFSCKPLPFALKRVLKEEGVRPSEAVMVGDQLLTDGLAGSLAGVRTILVLPQSETEPWFTHLSRVAERPFLKRVPVEG